MVRTTAAPVTTELLATNARTLPKDFSDSRFAQYWRITIRPSGHYKSLILPVPTADRQTYF